MDDRRARWTFPIMVGVVAAYFIAGLAAGFVNNAKKPAPTTSQEKR
jgi:hypothetical protein